MAKHCSLHTQTNEAKGGDSEEKCGKGENDEEEKILFIFGRLSVYQFPCSFDSLLHQLKHRMRQNEFAYRNSTFGKRKHSQPILCVSGFLLFPYQRTEPIWVHRPVAILFLKISRKKKMNLLNNKICAVNAPTSSLSISLSFFWLLVDIILLPNNSKSSSAKLDAWGTVAEQYCVVCWHAMFAE